MEFDQLSNHFMASDSYLEKVEFNKQELFYYQDFLENLYNYLEKTKATNEYNLHNIQAKYLILISKSSFEKIMQYKKDLSNNKVIAGAFLSKFLPNNLSSLNDLSNEEFITRLLKTKQPRFFAESEIKGGGKDWNNIELDILGDINVTVPVTIYDNGVWDSSDPNFKIHEKPFEGELLYSPGPLLTQSDEFIGLTPEYQEVVKNNQIDQLSYNKLIERRLLPLLIYANNKAKIEGRPAFIIMPAIGGGAFAGNFKGKIGNHLNIAMQTMLEKYYSKLPNIGMVYYDPFQECINESKIFGNIKYRVRPITKGYANQTQLASPEIFQEAGDNFTNYKIYKIVAWDHVSLPGNDFYQNSRWTDDGMAAAATNSMQAITGVAGEYNTAQGKYLPPKEYKDWEEIAKNTPLIARNNIFIVTESGDLLSLPEYIKPNFK